MSADSTAVTTPVPPPQPPRWSWRLWGVLCIASVAFAAFSLYNHPDFQRDEAIFIALFSGPFGATFYYGGYFLLRRLIYRINYRQVQTYNISEQAQTLQEELNKDFFTNLVRINFKYLDKYYLQTQEQGDKSFLLSAIAAVIGLAIVIAGIVMMFLDKTTPAYLTTAAGVISEFIAAVFFYLYNKTVLSMSQYHQKLVITQNIALALKITGDLPQDQRVQSQLALVEALTKDVNRLLSSPLSTQNDKT